MKTIYKKLLFLVLLLPFSVFAQSTLNGTVLDSKSKQPIPGVNILIQGTSGGTQTDFDGKFKLSNVKKGDKIVASYVGYKRATINYDSQKEVIISLEEESNQLQEVVVQTGYGSVKKKDATGSVTLITSKDFNKGAIISADQLISGKAPGVRITTEGGQPDAKPNIRIRGGASISSSNDPLIIIDGVPISSDNPAGISNPLSLINPNDIETFSILKDASATAIYGVRASNGVIIITTKKGSNGAAQFNFSSSVTAGKVDKKVKVMNSTDFTRFIQEYHPNFTNKLGVDDSSTNVVDDLSTSQIEGRIISDTDWQDQAFRTAISTDHSFSARANLYKKIPFRASIGYTNNQGLVWTSDYERLSYSFKMTPKLLNDDLKVDVNAKGTYSDKNVIDNDAVVNGVISMDPTKPVYDYSNSNGNIFGGFYQTTKLVGTQLQSEGQSNPRALLSQRKRPERVTRFLGNVEFDYKLPFLRDLRAIVNMGLDASITRIREVFSDNSISTYKAITGVFNPGVNFTENQTVTNKTWDSYLVYTKNLNGFVSKVDAQAGYSYQDFRIDGYKGEYRYNETTGLREPNINPNNPNARYFNNLNLQAFFARSNFDLLNKYLFTLTFRADGSSLFIKEKQWGFFPAAGFAWKLKEESFLKNASFFKELKFRLSWGKTGQQNITAAEGIGYYPSRPLFDIGNNNSQYLEGVTTYSARKYNPDVTWEKTSTFNVGLDFEFFKNGILSGSLDAYKRKTNDLLALVGAKPGQYLTNEYIGNVGSTESNGFEVNLIVKPIQSDNFNLNFAGNIAYNYVKVTDLNGSERVSAPESNIPNGTGNKIAFHPLGFQPYSASLFEQIYDSNGQPIVGAYVDRNNDGKITDDDKYYTALRPNWTYGFNTSFNYKNFDFTANFRGQLGGQVYNARILTNGWTDKSTAGITESLSNVLNFYNGDASPLFKNFNGNASQSDYFLQDATFLRCDNVTIGYKFAKFVNKSSLRVYASVNNVFIITKYSGQDPENFNAIDNNFYPRPRMYTFGVSLDF